MSEHLKLTRGSRIEDETGLPAVDYARQALARDLDARLAHGPASSEDGVAPRVVLRTDPRMENFADYRLNAEPDQLSITGSDALGCIHGIYDFAERYLQADPMQWVTRRVPELTGSVSVPLGVQAASRPTFRHRGFFFNDEDLLVGFQRKRINDGFNPEVWRNLFETVLRLGGTFVIPGTNTFSDESQIALASEMGLFIGQHHAEPLGCPTYHTWPRQLPYSLSQHEDVFVRNWRRAIERQAGSRVIWCLGFRGFLDWPFWGSDPSVPDDADDEQKAAVINRAVELQYQLVHEIRPGEAHEFVFYCRAEMFPLLKKNLLKLPPETMLVLTPEQLEDPGGVGNERPSGLYAWANFFNLLSDARIMSRDPVDIGRIMEDAVEHGHTDCFVLNVGTLREKGFHIRQYAKLARDEAGWRERATGEAWFTTYAKEVLGSENEAVEDVYRRLVRIRNGLVSRGDEGYFTLVEVLLKGLYTRQDSLETSVFRHIPGNGLGEKVNRLADAYGASAAQWDVAWQRARAAEAEVAPAAKLFYRQEALAQTEKMHHLDSMMYDFARSGAAYLEGQYADARHLSWQAVQHAEDALALERRIDTDRFQGWHRNDMNCRTWKIRDLLETWHRMLDDLRFLNLPYQSRNPKLVYRHQYQPNFDSAYMRERELMIDNEA